MNLESVKKEVRQHANKKQAQGMARFFKTGPGEYAQGDVFLGIKVPILRALSKQYQTLSFEETLELLKSSIHEERLLALFILLFQYRKADLVNKEKIYKAYLKHSKYINNWDLVDVTAKHIVGNFLQDKDRSPLYDLAHSKDLWEKRIAILSTFHFIDHDDFDDTLNISKILLSDSHDLIHKAVGWMLREVGKRDRECEEMFLKKHYKIMPRTMLRYAIEHFPETKRKAYLLGRI